MNEQDPNQVNSMLNEFGAWVTFYWILGIAVLNGFIRYYQRIDRRDAKHSFFVLCGEFAICCLVSLVTFALCDYASLSWQYTAVAIGYTSYKGTSSLVKLSSIFNAIKKEIKL